MIKKIHAICIITLLFIGTSNAQTYDLLNDRLKSNDTIFVKYKFESLSNDIIENYLTKNAVKNNWEPLPIKNLPDINLFLKNFDFEQARKSVLINNKSDSLIDFSKMNKNAVKIIETEKHLKNGNDYIVITKPIFNCDKTWAISYIYGVYHFDVGATGDLVIFRKIDCEWVRFHHITMWIS